RYARLDVVSTFFDPSTETLEREQLRSLQFRKLQQLLDQILSRNAFYRRKLNGNVTTWADYHELPFTTKQEIAEDQLLHPPFGTNLTYPLDKYVKLHQTSGTTG